MNDHAIPEDLLRAGSGHSRWLERLASTLVQDPSQADDLVQEAWLEATRRPPSPTAPRAWLATVVRNAARRLGRSDRARRDREWTARGADDHEVVSAWSAHSADVLDRARLQRELADRVLTLSEPYRTAVLLRFFEDLPPREIARRTGRPVETVRTHVQRGLALLRDDLDNEYGDRRRWGLLMLPLAAGGLVGRAAKLAPAATTGSSVAQLALGAGIVVAAAAFVPTAADGGGIDVARPEPDAPAEIVEAERPEPEGEKEEATTEAAVSVPDPIDETPPQRARGPVLAPQREQEPEPDESRRRVPSAFAIDRVATTTTPPGAVRLRKQKVIVGLDTKAAKAAILDQGGRKVSIWGEGPEQKLTVDEFHLMTTEVTHEQFYEFVAATGAKPPESWGKAAIDEAQHAFLVRQAELRGREPSAPRVRFERSDWWDANWEGVAVEVPDELRMRPVTEINYESATAYARWAGMRLPTEIEYQRAVRRGTRDLYPWGDEWKHFVAITSEERSSDPFRVGSRPANPDGIYDLAGNVWEWTTSPYEPFDRYKNGWLELPDGRRVDLLCNWDPNQRVTVGGSYKSEPLAARATTRRATDRFQTTEALGFRCAASSRAGLDRAHSLHDVLRRSVRPELDYDAVVAIDRWRSGTRDGEQPSSYAIVTAYEHLSFVPVRELDPNEARGLERGTEDGELVKLGVLSTSLDVLSPPLGSGTWIVAWRGFERESAELVFLDTDGVEILTVPHGYLSRGRLHEGRIARWPDDGRARIDAAIPFGRRGYELRLSLQVRGIEGDWRK